MKRADERKKELMKSLVEGAIMGLAFFVMFGSMLYRKVECAPKWGYILP